MSQERAHSERFDAAGQAAGLGRDRDELPENPNAVEDRELRDWIANNPHDAKPPRCLDCERSLSDGRRWLCSTCCPGDEADELRRDELREMRDSYERHPRDGGPECWADGWPDEAAELERLEAATDMAGAAPKCDSGQS